MSDAKQLEKSWKENPRWKGITRPYKAEEVLRLRPSVHVEHSLARHGADKLWKLIHEESYIAALGALTGNQAVEMVQAGLKAIYLSGWQVAADANLAGDMYPDQSIYPANSVPSVVRRINNALTRADQVAKLAGKGTSSCPGGEDWYVPIVADAEAGFGGVLNAYELMKGMIEAGAAAAHYEDQLASEKKCGHMGGKVLVPMQEFIKKLIAARLASDVLDVPTLIVARTDADGAQLLTSDIDDRDKPFILPGQRTSEGFYRIREGLDYAIARAIAYAPYADLVWCETSKPDMGEAKRFAEAVLKAHPGKPLMYNCSPSFNWKKNLSDADIARFQSELGKMGYKFQFVTLAGFHSLNAGMFELAKAYGKEGMSAYSRLQQKEFGMETEGYTATKHQTFVGAGWFDQVQLTVSGGDASTTAVKGSTEEAQFKK
jgi:isocitrate lyase